MPELPEVEFIRHGLKKNILHKKILSVEVLVKKLVQSNRDDFQKNLRGNAFQDIERIGKLLMFKLEQGEKYLLIHLKMTGQLVYHFNRKTVAGRPKTSLAVAGGHRLTPSDIGNLPNKFTRAIFYFADGSALFFNDMRKFGYFKLVAATEKERIQKENFGPDAVSKELTFNVFKKILASRPNARLKAVLLDQGLMAGIGNIYADEICFYAGVLPTRIIKKISSGEIKKLYQGVRKILPKAIQCGGTTFGIYTEGHFVGAQGQRGNYCDYLMVYDRAGERCKRCKTGVINKKAVAGRGTSFCPMCQK